jgi:hypothetical protein
MRNVYKILASNPEETIWETGIDGRIILKLVLIEYGVRVGTDFNRLKMWSNDNVKTIINIISIFATWAIIGVSERTMFRRIISFMDCLGKNSMTLSTVEFSKLKIELIVENVFF